MTTFRLALALIVCFILINGAVAQSSHPRLMADKNDIAKAKSWIQQYPWYRDLFEKNKKEIDEFMQQRPIFVSPIKQTYQYKMYICPKHDVTLMFELYKPYEHRCPKDTTERYSGGKYDMAWAGWYNRVVASNLVWMGILYQVYGDERYAEAGREILLKFADLYLKYPTENTILGPAHVFFGTLSESFWGVDMAYGYDFLYTYKGFTDADRKKLKDEFFYPLAEITQKFPESASNRQLWYNNVSAAVGFLYNDQKLIDFAFKGEYGFEWQLGPALPESGFWAEWSGYHYVALRGMIHLAEMARHNGMDLYHMEIAGRTMKKMFDAPFEIILPNYEFPRSKDSGGGNILEYATFYEIAYAIYKDPRYLAILNLTKLQRGKQIVGETSAKGETEVPITMFNLDPEIPKDTSDIYPTESFNLEGNGFAVMRNGEGAQQRYLYLDYGIMGGEHGHPDRLIMGYYANGRNWLVDPLNESYQDPMLQLWFRQTFAHNTVVINQTSQTWTNGYGIFFGALPTLQVASGGSVTAYPGVKLTRTMLQVEDYFIDLFDVDAPEKRIIDWPLHSFGKLTLNGVHLKPEPVDRFGHQPGVPGYDQLTHIQSGKTNGAWSGDFTDNNQHLMVKAIGENNTEIFQAVSPRIGGFYKQMEKNPKPMGTVFSRRETNATRFAHLIQAYDSTPTVTSFEKGPGGTSYIVKRNKGEDVLFADVLHSKYWLVRKDGNTPAVLAGFNVKEIMFENKILVQTEFPLPKLECRWSAQNLSVITAPRFGQVKIWAPGVTSAQLNGQPYAVEKQEDYIVFRQAAGTSIEILASKDSTLFLGRTNKLTVRVFNPTDKPIEGKVTLSLTKDWSERLNSQLTWWGGIVNLKATNKGPIQRRTFPVSYNKNVNWIEGISSENKRIPARGVETFIVQLAVPNDAPPVTYPTIISFGNETVQKSLEVKAPVTAELTLPNAEKEILWVTLTNQTSAPLTFSPKLIPDPAWKISSPLKSTISLTAGEIKRIAVPLKFSGYKPAEQRYPIRLQVAQGAFRMEIERDFYVGVAHFAAKAPALDGSWDGWNTANPMTIANANQICKLLFGSQPWHGLQDLSVKTYVMYDEKYLYVGTEITDDSLVNHWNFPTMSYPWDSDCMEVILDTRTTSDQGSDPPTPGLFRHLSMAEYRTTDFGPSMWQGGGAGGPLIPKPNLVSGAETYYTRTKAGYTLICRYPLVSLENVIAKPGYKIGFDIAANDNDGTNYRKNQHIWAGYNQNQSWWNMGTIGALIFGAKK